MPEVLVDLIGPRPLRTLGIEQGEQKLKNTHPRTGWTLVVEDRPGVYMLTTSPGISMLKEVTVSPS